MIMVAVGWVADRFGGMVEVDDYGYDERFKGQNQ
jgi:hypothetical protein